MFINIKLVMATLVTLSAVPVSSGRTNRRHNSINVNVQRDVDGDVELVASDMSPASDIDAGTLVKRSKGKPRANGGKGHRLIQVNDSKCGPNGAVWPPNVAAGPNGHINWLNCGISSSTPSKDHGWTPPKVTLKDLSYMDFSSALKNDKSPFAACRKYVDAFERVAKSHGLPAIMLASFAMQESTCNPKATGKGGEVGMFQLAPANCKGVSRTQCYDAETNMRLAANYMKTQLDAAGGNVLLMIGTYNGYYRGMTYNDAVKARHSNCCYCQNNLDYIHQVVNGWFQGLESTSFGKDGIKLKSPVALGTFKNLEVCSRKRSIPPTLSSFRNTPGWTF
ncbi:hypothetical protein FRB94_007737 [Tulasnella sp. JGI-2019a]|nr:hypothetical protein FRB94_007737 [Tulasnella sp. JGI-2019a]